MKNKNKNYTEGQTCSVLKNSMPVILSPFTMTSFGVTNGRNSHFSSRANSISSGTARMLTKPKKHKLVCDLEQE